MNSNIFGVGKVFFLAEEHLDSGLEFEYIFLEFPVPVIFSIFECNVFGLEYDDSAPKDFILLLEFFYGKLIGLMLF